MLYHLYEMTHAAMTPWRTAAQFNHAVLTHPLNPLSYSLIGKTSAAGLEVFESITRRYGKPTFDLPYTHIDGVSAPVTEKIVWARDFCQLRHFHRDPQTLSAIGGQPDPKVLIVAPMSGHYATLLRGTVEAMMPEHDVYITDWVDARMVPLSKGGFDLDDYIDYVIEMVRFLGPNTHVMAVCQPGPAVLAATALMAEDEDDATPASLIIMGSPIDPRQSPTVPNVLAETKPYDWFENNVVMNVPWPQAGFGRPVYPGFIQLSSFMAMNQDKHVDAHKRYYKNLIKGDGASTQKHREFYEEYLAVMDLTAEFYLQTIDKIFQRHLLPRGELDHRGHIVDPAKITQTALMTVEGEDDDISGIGQTQAAHDLCINIPDPMRTDYVQPSAGHYGVFNGKRWETQIQPRVRDFIRAHDRETPEK